MESQTISREIIKPSSPTPHHQKIYNLSLIDQISPAYHVPTIFYYPNLENTPKTPQPISQTTKILKQSLSKTLTQFYPLAGRTTNDGLSIECNDEGVPFVVAKFETNLSQFLNEPDLKVCSAFVPGPVTSVDPGPGAEVIMIQVNYFDCGGIVIGLLFHHSVGDISTIGTFMKYWASNAHGHERCCGQKTIMPPPDFTLSSLFPVIPELPKEIYFNNVMARYLKYGKTVVRRYVFDALAISKVRSKLAQQVGLNHHSPPSKAEIVSALMWKYFMIVSSQNNNNNNVNNNNDSMSLMTYILDLRSTKADPPFSDNSFGNFVWVVPASISLTMSNDIDQPDTELENVLIDKLRSALSKVDVDFLKRMQGDDRFSGYCKNKEDGWDEFPENADYLSMWSDIGLNDVDFGWGKPVWVTRCDSNSDTEKMFLNMLRLTDTRNRDGVEAWLNWDEKYIQALDDIEELRELASIDPSPLD